MKKWLVLVVVLIMSIAPLTSQEVVQGIVPGQQHFKPYLSIGTGSSFSVINNHMEIRDHYKFGYHFFIQLQTKEWVYWSGEFTYFPLHNSDPALININSWNTELNVNPVFRIGESDLLFKTMFGFGYMNWSGTYVGPSMKDKNNWAYGERLEQEWIFGNLGCGVERNFGENFTISGDFRLRFASHEKELLSISDTGFFIGLRWNMRVNNSSKDNDKHLNHRRNPNDKRSRVYKWLKNR